MAESSDNYLESSRVFYYENNADIVVADFIRNFNKGKCLILCIGTDRYIGDCLGPITGTLLKSRGFQLPVFGTLENPVHAVNLKRNVKLISDEYPDYTIIAVDACLGDDEHVGSIQARKGCIYPGKGVGKSLPAIGDIAIIGIVDSADRDDFFTMHNIRLNTVMKMAETITSGIIKAFR